MSAPQSLVITGAAGGLGRAFAVEAARRGWNLVLTDVTPLDELAAYLSDAHGVRVGTVYADLRTAAGRDQLFAALPRTGLAGLVNVAGVDHEGSIASRSRDDLLDIVGVNIEATVDVTRELLARRDRSRRFLLITVCSLAAATPMPYKATYAASKRFLHDFTLALREELGDDAMVTALCPAGLPTTTASVRGIYSQGALGRLTSVSPGRAAAAAFDAAEAGRAVCVPGWINRLLYRAAPLVPTALVVRATGRRWARARCDAFRVAEESLEAGRRASMSTAEPRRRLEAA
jgi:short-subunit dehydrogenase